MKLLSLITITAIIVFGALAYLFHHWWIALFSLLFMYSFERKGGIE